MDSGRHQRRPVGKTGLANSCFYFVNSIASRTYTRKCISYAVMGLPHKLLVDDRDIAMIIIVIHTSRVRERRMQRYIVQQLIKNFRGGGFVPIH